MSAWRRVRRSSPCPICTKPDWCTVSADGAVAHCMRVASDRPCDGGGWIHRLSGAPTTPPPLPSAPAVAPLATARLDEIGRALLARLSLSDSHRAALEKRGLDAEAIARHGYKTWPLEGRAKLARDLRAIFPDEDLLRYPGVCMKTGDRGDYLSWRGGPGLLVPVRDFDGRIRGFQIRLDNPKDGPKYIWLSSASEDNPDGPSPGSPIHVARPRELRDPGAVWDTEGPIKANVAADRLGALVIAMPGVSANRRGAVEAAQAHGAKRAVIAFDADVDPKTVATVAAAALALAQRLRAAGLEVFQAHWEAGMAKGIDDLLQAGGTPEVRPFPIQSPEASGTASAPAAGERSGRTDWGNAERLVRLRGEDFRYCGPWRKFLIWDGARWAIDETGEVLRLARATVRDIHAEARRAFVLAADERDPDARKRLAAEADRIKRHAVASEHKDRLAAMVALAQSEPGIPLLPAALDSDPWGLNVGNGTVDLKTGNLRPHRREDMLTRLAPVEFDSAASAPTWTAFLDRIFGGNVELIGFMQRAIGYALTGDTSERCLFIMHGDGANGKSTMLRMILALLGDYAQQAPVDLLMMKSKNDGDAPSPSLAKLRGARVAAVVEAEEGRRLAESLVKHLTGQDRVTARSLYGEPFEFEPEFKLFLATNHRPKIRGTDPAIWDRIRLVPFTVSIPKKDRDGKLFDKLKGELPGVLAWAIAGCIGWQRDGLRPPREVEAATATYRADSDILGGFLRDRCIMTPAASASAKDLYAAYRAWCEDQDERPAGRQDFGAELAKRGCDSGRRKGRAHWYRIGLLAEQGEEGEKGEEVSGTSPMEAVFPPTEQQYEKGSTFSPSSPEGPEPEEVL